MSNEKAEPVHPNIDKLAQLIGTNSKIEKAIIDFIRQNPGKQHSKLK